MGIADIDKSQKCKFDSHGNNSYHDDKFSVAIRRQA